MDIKILSTYSIWWILVILGLSLVLSVLFYHKKQYSELSNAKRIFLLIMRFISLFIIGALLLKPVVKLISNKKQKPSVVFAVDNSQSIVNGKDSALNKEYYKKELNEVIKQLKNEYDVKTIEFGSEINDSLSYSFTQRETNFESLFELFRTKFYNENIGSMILVSDGLVNKGTDPLYLSERLSFPIYTIPVGDTQTYKDIFIDKTEYNFETFLGNNFPIIINIKAKKLKGEDASVKILRFNKVIAEEKLNISSDDFFEKVFFSVKADSLGLQSYQVQITTQGNEINEQNNFKEIVVDVKEDKTKVLLLYDGYHPDISVIRTAISSSIGYEFTAQNINNFNRTVDEFACVILYQLPSESNTLVKLYSTLIDKEIPIWFILGQKSSIKSINELNTGFYLEQEKTMFFDAHGVFNRDFSLFKYDWDEIDLLNFPPLSVNLGNYKLEPASEVLMFQGIEDQKTNYPLWFFTTNGNQRIGVLFGEGIWRWRIFEYSKHKTHQAIDNLVFKTIQFLSVPNKKSFFEIDIPSTISFGNSINAIARVYNKSYELINENKLQLEIENSKKEKYAFTFQPFNNYYKLDAGALPVGNYTYKAKTLIGDKELIKTGRFIVIKSDIENHQLVANHDLLFKLSKQTDGEMIEISQLNNLVLKLKQHTDIRESIFKIQKYVDLLNRKILFLILFLLLVSEWFFRKFWGIS